MRILIHSASGDSSGIAYLMQKEGHEVYFYVKDSTYRRIQDGILTKVPTLEAGLKTKPDFVLFDLNGDGKKVDELRKQGFKVIGSSALADKLEMDRSYGTAVAKQYGIRVPKTTEFKSLDEAIAFVKAQKKPYAIKIDNNKSESSSYVAKDAEDMLDYLSYSKEGGTIGGSDTFILQEVVKGAEVSTELWFSHGLPIWPPNSTFETKKFLAGELGQRTGCETSLVFHYEGDLSRIVDATIRKLFPLLKHAQYTGPLDVNCIVSEEDHQPYFLEWTPRLGYSAIYAFCSMLGMPIANFFYRVSRGPFTIPFKALWGSSLKLSIPPYPVEIENKRAAEDVYGRTQGIRINGKHGPDFIPIDIQKGKRSDLEVAGTSCIIGECTGRGQTLMEAWRSAQKVFDSVEIPNKQGRYTDGVEDAWKRISKLRNWGYKDLPVPNNLSGSEPKPDSTPFGGRQTLGR